MATQVPKLWLPGWLLNELVVCSEANKIRTVRHQIAGRGEVGRKVGSGKRDAQPENERELALPSCVLLVRLFQFHARTDQALSR
jgi:hypothetical protein